MRRKRPGKLTISQARQRICAAENSEIRDCTSEMTG
jgi:hypothetical protein